MEYRILTRAETSKFPKIDHAGTMERIYYIREGRLVLEKEHWDLEDWSNQEKKSRTAARLKQYDEGETVFGAFDGSALVGVSVFKPNPLQSAAERFNFGGIWVSQWRKALTVHVWKFWKCQNNESPQKRRFKGEIRYKENRSNHGGIRIP